MKQQSIDRRLSKCKKKLDAAEEQREKCLLGNTWHTDAEAYHAQQVLEMDKFKSAFAKGHASTYGTVTPIIADALKDLSSARNRIRIFAEWQRDEMRRTAKQHQYYDLKVNYLTSKVEALKAQKDAEKIFAY